MKKTGNDNGSYPIITYIILVLILSLAALPFIAYGEERIINVKAEIDAEEVGLLDTVKLTVSVEAENITRVPKPEVPTMKGFSILTESSATRSSISIVNGKTTRTKTITYTYVLKPQSRGSFTIYPVTLRYGNAVYSTDPITISVLEGRRRQEKESFILDDGTIIDVDALKEDIFILIQPQQAKIYQNEQLYLTYALYSRLDIDSISLKQNPAFPGFFIEDIYSATKLTYNKESYEGKLYTFSIIKKVVLFPLSPGHFSPDPLVLEATVILKSKDLFDMYGRPFTFTLKSNEVAIDALSLPAKSEDKEFSGIVGELTTDISTPVYTAATGESFSCFLVMKSTGNLNLITDPGIHTSKRTRVYLSGTMLERVEERDRIYFVKKFEYTLIPEESGKLEITNPEILYFSTEKGKYLFASSDPAVLTITGEDIARDKLLKDEKRSFQAGSLQFIKSNVKSLKNTRTSPLYGSPYYIYHVLLSALALLFFFFIMKKTKLEKNKGLLRKRRACASALGLLAQADAAIERHNYDEAVDIIHKSLTSYLADKLLLRPQDISFKNVQQLLGGLTGAANVTKESFKSVFETCTRLKFSQRQVEDVRLVRELKSRSFETINAMEFPADKNSREAGR